ncbi:MAG: adenosine deaminase [Planctomycetia bacterium]|nr:adenosine deaminase [Planctomycetia bacterium]
MPKVELHLHLDGAFPLDFLFELIHKYGDDPRINSISDLQNRFIFKDFSHFIDTWFWKNQFFREPIDFEESVYQTLLKLYHQNIVYLEAFFSPWDYKNLGVNPTDIIQANLNAVKRAEKDFNIRCRLIVDITRDHGHEYAIDRLNEITPFLGEDIIGIGLGGSEQNYPTYLFKNVFNEAKKRGFHCVAHAGEVMGPKSIWSAINDLKVERIGHGVRAIEDPKLVEYLQIEQIPLEICLISNIKTGIYSGFTDHPFAELFSKGLLVTVNSDDPTMFGSTLANEYSILYQELNLSMSEIRNIQINAVESSFALLEEKKKIKEIMNKYWTENMISITNN